jgi:hypothetical protein
MLVMFLVVGVFAFLGFIVWLDSAAERSRRRARLGGEAVRRVS